jgi:hypothetical protein
MNVLKGWRKNYLINCTNNDSLITFERALIISNKNLLR